MTDRPATRMLPRFSERQWALLRAMGYDRTTGRSEKYVFPGTELPGGYTLSRNGDQLMRAGSVFRRYHIVRSYYANGVERVDHPRQGVRYFLNGARTDQRGGGGKIAIRLEGLVDPGAYKRPVPAGMRQKMIAAGKPPRCAATGSTDNPEIDHKEGQPQAHGYSDQNDEANYQWLCPLMNKLKRSACKRCAETGNRYDARQDGYSVGWTEGGSRFERDGVGCRGCLLYDFHAFRRALPPPSAGDQTA